MSLADLACLEHREILLPLPLSDGIKGVQGQKAVLNLRELKLQMVLSHHAGAGY